MFFGWFGFMFLLYFILTVNFSHSFRCTHSVALIPLHSFRCTHSVALIMIIIILIIIIIRI